MTAKSLDIKGRWRNVTIGFRVSPAENERINKLVALSGLPKQQYIRMKLEDETIIVNPNPRMLKGLKNILIEILSELKKADENQLLDQEIVDILKIIANILDDMRGE